MNTQPFHTRMFVGFSIFTFFLISFTWLIFDWERFLHSPLIPMGTSIDYILPSGTSIRVLANDLNQLGLLQRPYYLMLLGYLNGDAKHLRAGEYRFVEGTTPGQLLNQIAQGQVLWREMTFIEGWTFHQMMEELDSNPLIVHKLVGVPPVLVMMELGVSGINPEGEFFPDTYRYTAGMSDEAILLEAYHAMQTNLNQEWKNREPNVPYSDPYQALIVASITEKEASLNTERSEIAGVINRRLAKGMLLQMDTTVIYAMGPDFVPPLKKENLDIDSPYNTYMYHGLPPTPICMPGLESIHAALHPTGGDVLYFVARGNGTQQFSATYQQQKAAVNLYEGHRR